MAASHLCRSLSLFRQVLSANLTAINLDAFIATSILIQFEVWTSTDFVSTQDEGVLSFDPSRDRIFSLCSDMKQVFLKTVPFWLDQPSIFMPQIAHNPRNTLLDASHRWSSTVVDFQDHFSYQQALTLESLDIPISNVPDTELAGLQDHLCKSEELSNPALEGYKTVVTELCLIISFLSDANFSDSISSESPLLPDLARYVFSFPVLCRGQFASMIQQRDPHALLVLYHFYRAVKILLPPDKCWWARDRASLSEIILREWLARDI